MQWLEKCGMLSINQWSWNLNRKMYSTLKIVSCFFILPLLLTLGVFIFIIFQLILLKKIFHLNVFYFISIPHVNHYEMHLYLKIKIIFSLKVRHPFTLNNLLKWCKLSIIQHRATIYGSPKRKVSFYIYCILASYISWL